MRLSPTLLARRQPLIRFLGRHNPPAKIDHTPHTHPAAPTSFSLPETFASYRQKAQQHGPLGKNQQQQNTPLLNPYSNSINTNSSTNSSSSNADMSSSSSSSSSSIGNQTGTALGSIRPQRPGVAFDRTELEPRFWRSVGWSADEIEAVESGGASMLA